MAAAKRKAGEVDALIGRNVRRFREQLGGTQDDLARELREGGWQASGLTVAALERGDRALLHEEVLLLADVLNVSVEELHAGDRNEFVRVRSLYPENTEFLRGRLTQSRLPERYPTWSETQSHRQHIQIDTGGYIEIVAAREAEGYAAKRLGISPDEVVRHSLALWHRTLTEERDARTAERTPPDASPRSRTIVRGHVSRELLAELQQAEEGQGT
jgi:transcriptional regulator with XRE-family HTH domain